MSSVDKNIKWKILDGLLSSNNLITLFVTFRHSQFRS